MPSLRIIMPLMWAVLLAFGPPALNHITLPLRIGTTMISAAAIYSLATSIRGWKQLLLAPLYVVLLLLQLLIWWIPWG